MCTNLCTLSVYIRNVGSVIRGVFIFFYSKNVESLYERACTSTNHDTSTITVAIATVLFIEGKINRNLERLSLSYGLIVRSRYAGESIDRVVLKLISIECKNFSTNKLYVLFPIIQLPCSYYDVQHRTNYV